MKICIFTTTIDKKDGGPSRSVPLLSKGLSEIGVDITLITCQTDNMNTHILEDSDVKLKVIPKNISQRDINKLIKEENYDLIHMQNLWNPLYHKVVKVAKKNSIPYIMTPRGCLEPWCMKQKRIKKMLALALYQRKDLQDANCILATSDMEAENIRRIGLTTPIAIIPNGINVTDYKCRKQDNQTKIKQQLCFVSRIHEKKGIEFLISAWENISPKHPDWKVVVAGNGEEEYIKSLNRKIEDKHLQESFKIIPPVFGEQKKELYCESSVFVLPTYSENFGMVIAEAMSCGLPVITTNGTPWQVLNDRRLGWCIDLSVDNLVNAIELAIGTDSKDLFEMGQKASEYIESTFDYIHIATELYEVYKWIVLDSTVPKTVHMVQ